MTKHSSTRPWRRRVALPAAVTGMVALAAMAGVPTASAVDRGTFELDGDATASATLAGDDWSNALTGGGSAGQLASSGVVADPLNTTIFTGGGSKDDLPISGWRHTNGAVPDKDEITNAYATAYNKDGDLVVYFGADRYATNGNAALGFWFLQQDVAPVAGGTFTGEHKDGDILVLSEFTNGGSQPTIQVYEWLSGGPINGTLKLLTDSSSTCNATQAGTSDPTACAIVNTGAVASPWEYIPKGKTVDSDFAKGAFFEGGINVSRLFAAQGQSAPCITSFVAETRSSQSVDATLKDFVAGDFNLCSASIAIEGSDVNEVGDPHTFTVTVSKTVAGIPSPVSGVKPTVTLVASGGAAVTDRTDGCATTGTDSNGECTVTFTSDQAGIVLGSASATFESGGQTFNVATGTTAATGAAVKRFVDAQIDINPPIDTNGITESHTFTVDVQQDDGYPAGTPGDAASGFGPAPDGTKPEVTLTATDGAVVTSKTDSCATTGTVGGSCTVVFTSNTAGTVTGSATATLAFAKGGGLPGDVRVTRTTDGAAANSDAAVKHFVDGTLAWLKHDQDGNLLGGATFQVCRTTSYDSAAKAHTALSTPVCLSVTDNASPDVDSDAGELKLDELVMGTYTVKETAAPAGYSFDPDDVKTAKVETLAPDASIGIAFVNTQLYKMIVLTCNQVTNELVVSTVTLDGTARDTLGASTDPAAQTLCNLEGAKFEDLRKGTHAPSVVVPKE